MIPIDSFRELMKYSKYHPNKSPWNNEWSDIELLYYRNYILPNIDAFPEAIIPKKIHQIWLGGELPEKYKSFVESWKIWNPEYEYKLWTDKDADTFEFERPDIYYGSQNMGTRSDYFSYEILRKHGGIYVDVDFECLQSFEDLMFLKFFTSVAYDPKLEIYHGLMASVPNHPILDSCIKDIIPYTGENGEKIMDSTGPYHLTRCLLKNVDSETEGVVAFPVQFFYPWPNYERFGKSPYRYIQPLSYAIHHWTVSWLKP
jgi:inositol phosphorylceramide mannosyltransferase catalytic subunit